MKGKRISAFFLMLLVACQSQHVSNTSVLSFTEGKADHQQTAQEKPQDKLTIARPLRYRPQGSDFVIVNGTKRFNRALYGTGTAFRVETGDLPEFLMYMPNKGGNLKMGIATAEGNKWLIDAAHIKAIYNPGAMRYEIKDPLLGEGQLNLQVLAMADAEGMLVSLETTPDIKPFELIWTYGGASGHRPARDGDIGADPEEGFYLYPEHAKGNVFEIKDNTFLLGFEIGKKNADNYEQDITGVEDKGAQIYGIAAPGTSLKIGDANQQDSPKTLWQSGKSDLPLVVGSKELKGNQKIYFGLQNNLSAKPKTYQELPDAFSKADEKRKKIAGQVKIKTPDPYLNTLGGALSIAADAIWDGQSYMHGAIAWRMPLNGWRGAYVADALGWHDRARTHFRGYSDAQVTSPESGPVVPDPEKNLARQKEEIGISLYTEGYISRNPTKKKVAHHYDMNMVFIDEMLRHFLWTGDKAYVQEAWPILERHLDWEKRNFDADNDGLYDAYASFWASDAVQYSGGGVTHSSAYHHFSNKTAARLATLIGKDPKPYQQEADKIKKALNATLWLSDKGWYAEYKDLLGLQKLHPAAALLTVYHTLDSQVPDPFQAYQTLRYVDTQIPHIPILNSDLPDENLVTLTTSNWMPYTWSVNNVAMAEVAHTALAYWQAGRIEEANRLMRSILIESMYMGSSPGNLQQLSYYDHYRGELYRDFADGIGISSRALVEGMFGIVPDVLAGELEIRPGLPAGWNHASLETPDIKYAFKREGNKETYTIEPHFDKQLKLKFKAAAQKDKVAAVTVNGLSVKWANYAEVVGTPQILIEPEVADKYEIVISWSGESPAKAKYTPIVAKGDEVTLALGKAEVLEVNDPQKIIANSSRNKHELKARLTGGEGHHTFFVRTRQGDLNWWQPVDVELRAAYKLVAKSGADAHVILQNNTSTAFDKEVTVTAGNFSKKLKLQVKPYGASEEITIPTAALLPGTNKVVLKAGSESIATAELTNWELSTPEGQGALLYETVDLADHFNDKVTQIFKNEYLAPRPAVATLQLPKQGIGNWCYPLVTAEIDDAGLRAKAGEAGIVVLPNGLPFKTTGTSEGKNILFTSQWDNYPDQVAIPLQGNASHAYLLMAGSTNPMQSRFDNGEVTVNYTDGTQDKLVLRNPETWWPIEQDYYINDFSFAVEKPKPMRVHLKTGEVLTNFDYADIKGFAYDSYIPGGAATVLDLPLNPEKKLKSLEVRALANDVVIGLMGVTLVRI
ncbi:DUF4450 domain-containing protein [Pontibacter silvestris]|uniref:DUF4450 domain-containing protein n=1 Tax=Pontibacter silvestris TaxID=2305183 RepID=A0ABW4WZJ1_9BACT|nr:DUF4450 domain-containing protein [Pontibacter silvestris]MCC9135596.1 DUF4450 domain-containing protein [Pontibacter silvestris]